MITRRSFFAAIAATLVADPERLLWVPGAKKIFLPSIKVHEPLLDEINVITLRYLNRTVIEDLFYADYPFSKWAGSYTTNSISGDNFLAESSKYSR